MLLLIGHIYKDLIEINPIVKNQSGIKMGNRELCPFKKTISLIGKLKIKKTNYPTKEVNNMS